MRQAQDTLSADDLRAMLTALAVSDAGSMSAAASRIGRSTSSISRELQALERRLGVPIFVRFSRGIRPTEAGEHYLRRARALTRQLDDLHAEVRARGDDLIGLVRVSVAQMFGSMFVVPILSRLMLAHPGLSLEINLTAQPVDLFGGNTDIAVRHAWQRPDSGVVARRICIQRDVLCASPAYLARMGAPTSIRDLAHHPLIVHEMLRMSPLRLSQDGEEVTVPLNGRLVINSSFGVLEAARAGAGIAREAVVMVADDLATGRLIEVLPGTLQGSMTVFVMTRPRPELTPAVRAVTEALVTELVPVLREKDPLCVR